MVLKKPVVAYVAGSNLESHLIVTMLVKATELIEHYEETERARRSAQGTDRLIEVTSEECGKTFHFPESQRGTVQDFPQCGEYVEVGPPGWSEEATR
ncbi:MAG: hypothetical protein KGQ51_06200 [Planctomycetes bacterium]|nr:hypothetical protein [Planctomycetota bacterium]